MLIFLLEQLQNGESPHSHLLSGKRKKKRKEGDKNYERGGKNRNRKNIEKMRKKRREKKTERSNILRKPWNKWNMFYKISWFSKCIVFYYLQGYESNIFFTIAR